MHALGILVEFVLLSWAASLFWPLTPNRDLTRLTGKYFQWGLQNYTGIVLANQASTQTYGTVTTGYTESGNVYRQTNITTDQHNDVYLQLGNGTQHHAHLMNFGSICMPGNVVSIWYACRGRKLIPFVAYNLDTREQYKPPHESSKRGQKGIGNVVSYHTHLMLLLTFFAILCAFTSGGAFVLFALSIGVFAFAFRWTKKRFFVSGSAALYERSMANANELRRPQP